MTLSNTSVTRANQLRLAREQVGLSQVELARRARVSRRTVQRYEANESPGLTPELICVVSALTAARLLNGGKAEA
jgi:transcriptional regulator with XRE-family HTH domain